MYCCNFNGGMKPIHLFKSYKSQPAKRTYEYTLLMNINFLIAFSDKQFQKLIIWVTAGMKFHHLSVKKRFIEDE